MHLSVQRQLCPQQSRWEICPSSELFSRGGIYGIIQACKGIWHPGKFQTRNFIGHILINNLDLIQKCQ